MPLIEFSGFLAVPNCWRRKSSSFPQGYVSKRIVFVFITSLQCVFWEKCASVYFLDTHVPNSLKRWMFHIFLWLSLQEEHFLYLFLFLQNIVWEKCIHIRVFFWMPLCLVFKLERVSILFWVSCPKGTVFVFAVSFCYMLLRETCHCMSF